MTLDTASGRVTKDGDIPHWVRVDDVSNETGVSVYNPYTNRIEEIMWDQFQSAWANVPGSGSDYLLIKANRP